MIAFSPIQREKSSPSKPPGGKPVHNFRHRAIATKKPAPVAVGTGSGTAAVYAPPTVAPPPSAIAAVSQQLATSEQLSENTQTGAGIGANKSSVPVSVKLKGTGAYVTLALLGALLIVAFAWDRGML